MTLYFKKLSDQLCQANYIGSVEDVIAGRVRDDLKNRRFSAKSCQYGFEIGSPHSFEALGEAIVVNGYCYANSTDKKSPYYQKTIFGKDYCTSGIFLIPKNIKPNYLVKLDRKKAITLTALNKKIYDKVKAPFAIAGSVHFTQLKATAIVKPPIDHKNIFKDRKAYYPYPPQQLEAHHAFIMSVSALFSDKDHEKLHKELKCVLYHNPFDVEKGLTIHTHGVTLKKKTNQSQEILPHLVDQTLHIFNDTSLINEGYLEIFTLKALKELF